jgi:hypothetical protein
MSASLLLSSPGSVDARTVVSYSYTLHVGLSPVLGHKLKVKVNERGLRRGMLVMAKVVREVVALELLLLLLSTDTCYAWTV